MAQNGAYLLKGLLVVVDSLTRSHMFAGECARSAVFMYRYNTPGTGSAIRYW